MKAATNNYKCLSHPGKLAHAGTTQRSATAAHLPMRRPAPSHGPVAEDAPQESPTLMDAPRASSAQQAVPASDGVPRVLHIDRDADAGRALAALLMPEAHVVHVATLAEARRLLESGIFSMVVLDTALPDGDGSSLLNALTHTPLLVYSARQPDPRHTHVTFLPKPWTTPRQLWTSISGLLGMPSSQTAGD